MGASRILSGETIAGHLYICWSKQHDRIMRVLPSFVSDNLQMATARLHAAEGTGYDTVLTVEKQHEMFLPLAAAVTTTERVELGTSVIIAFLQKLVAFSCNRRWFLPSLWRSPYGGDGGPPGRAGQAPGAGLPMGGLVSHLAPASHAPSRTGFPPCSRSSTAPVRPLSSSKPV